MKNLILAILLLPSICLADWGGSAGLYSIVEANNLGTTGAEYGDGPAMIFEVHKNFTDRWQFSIMHKSYILTGAPFNDDYESSFTGVGIRYTWGTE